MCDREKEEKYRLYGGQDKPSEVDCGQGRRQGLQLPHPVSLCGQPCFCRKVFVSNRVGNIVPSLFHCKVEYFASADTTEVNSCCGCRHILRALGSIFKVQSCGMK